MTANFQEVIVTGPKWRRCNRMVIDDPFKGTPVVTIVTENVAALDDGSIVRQDAPQVSVIFEPTATVDLVDPETLAPLGKSMTHAEIYTALFSLFVQEVTAQEANQSAGAI